MYYSEETLEKELTEQGYQKIERKPWNVRTDDVIVLEQYGMGHMNSGFIPVVVTVPAYDYKEFHRSSNGEISQTTYRIHHKAMHETDAYRLTNWFQTYWYSFDTVEIWRKK